MRKINSALRVVIKKLTGGKYYSVYLISGLHCFLFGLEFGHKYTHNFNNKKLNLNLTDSDLKAY